ASLLSADRGEGWNLALLVHTTLPVGSDELGSPRADPSVRLMGSHDLLQRVGLGWNVAYEASSFEDAERVRHTLSRFLYTGTLGFSLAPRWGAFIELFGDLPASDSAPAAHTFDGGVTFLATPALQLDFAAGVGLNDAAPDWFVGAGLSLRRLRRTPGI
ncbi:MAG: transporter, partial [Thermoanaerobaculia bacterium]